MSNKKICLAASSGGHLEQIKMLAPLKEKYDMFLVTEGTNAADKGPYPKVYKLKQVNRREVMFPLYMLYNTVKSLRILSKEDPDLIISTGVLAVVPLCILAKLKRKKLIYIESFAKITSGTLTGKILYRFADVFFVQWEEMKDVYPNSIYAGGIY